MENVKATQCKGCQAWNSSSYLFKPMEVIQKSQHPNEVSSRQIGDSECFFISDGEARGKKERGVYKMSGSYWGSTSQGSSGLPLELVFLFILGWTSVQYIMLPECRGLSRLALGLSRECRKAMSVNGACGGRWGSSPVFRKPVAASLRAMQERRWVFDPFVVAAPWEFAEINALFSWRNEWLCLTSFVKLWGIHCLCLLTAEKEHMVLNGSSCENKTEQS